MVLVTTDLIGLPRAISDEVAARVRAQFQRRALAARPERLAHALRAGGAEEPGRPLRLRRRGPAPRRRLRRRARRPPRRGRGPGTRGPRARAPLGGARRGRLRRQPPRADARGREDRREPRRPRRPRRPGAEGHGEATARSAPCSSATPATTRRWAATSTGSAATTPGTPRPSWSRPTPAAIALFVMLCGGDQNPNPRGTLDLARRHGHALAAEVDRVLGTSLRPVRPPIRTALEVVLARLRPPHARDVRAGGDERGPLPPAPGAADAGRVRRGPAGSRRRRTRCRPSGSAGT